MIYSPINDNGILSTRYNNELFMLYEDLVKFKVIKMVTFRWLGQLSRMQELDPC